MTIKICFFGTYESRYPSNEILIEALRQAGADVHECHTPVWELRRHKFRLCRPLLALGLLARLLLAHAALAWSFWKIPAVDALVVGYFGHLDMPLAWALARIRAVPLVFSPLVSLYDTFCDDRGLVGPGNLLGRAFWWADRLGCLLADQVWLDTAEHADYFVQTFRIDPAKIRVIPIGADDRAFRPSERRADPSGLIRVLFVGKLIPLHGIETVLGAAALLQEEPIEFTIIGSGQQSDLARRLAADIRLDRITLIDWADPGELPRHYEQADICLGTFGTSGKAGRVIANKVYQGLAAGRPVVTADTVALRSLFRLGVEIVGCRPGDPEDLARHILALAANGPLRRSLGLQGRRAFDERFTSQAIGKVAAGHLGSLIPGLLPGDRMAWGSQPEFYGPRHRYRERLLFQVLRSNLQGGMVVDAACGSGSLAARLARAGYRVIGLDLSWDFLRFIAGSPAPGGVALVRADISSLPIGDGRADGVVAGEILEHLLDDELAVREFFRILRPGGVCAVSVPADPDQWHWHDDWVGHVRRYRREDLKGLLERAGFEVEVIQQFGYPFVSLFHYKVYLPHLRRSRASAGGPPGAGGRLTRAAGSVLFALFLADRLFEASGRGIGLIALARKPTAALSLRRTVAWPNPASA